MEFKQYKRKGLSEMIALKDFVGQDMSKVSVSEPDKQLSPEEFSEGYIARNPKNHDDMWYVAKKYFDENLEEFVPTGVSPGPFGMIHLGHGSFGEAIRAAKSGHKIARSGWNGKGMFLYHVPENSYPAQTDAAKSTFGDMVPYGAYIAMKTVQNNVVPWLASQTDVLAEDWTIVD